MEPRKNTKNNLLAFNIRRRNKIREEFDTFNLNSQKSEWIAYSTNEQLIKDLRSGNAKQIYIDNISLPHLTENELTVDEFKKIIYAKIQDKNIAKHYIRYLHQSGISDISSFATYNLLRVETGRQFKCIKLRTDIITNPDGNITFIERFLLNDRGVKDKEIHPIAVITTTSQTFFDETTNQVLHTFSSDKVYILSDKEYEISEDETKATLVKSSLFDLTFDENGRGINDKDIYNRIGESADDINYELNNEIDILVDENADLRKVIENEKNKESSTSNSITTSDEKIEDLSSSTSIISQTDETIFKKITNQAEDSFSSKNESSMSEDDLIITSLTFNEKRRKIIKEKFDAFNSGNSEWSASEYETSLDLRDTNALAIYINNVPLLKLDNNKMIEDKITIDEFKKILNGAIEEKQIVHHYMNYLHQGGISDISGKVTSDLLPKEISKTVNRIFEKHKLRTDIITNLDGSTTLIERFSVTDRCMDSSGISINPCAVITTTSTVYFDKNSQKLRHDFVSDEVYLLSDQEFNIIEDKAKLVKTTLFDTIFDKNGKIILDNNIHNKIGKTIDEVNNELNEIITIQLEKQPKKNEFSKSNSSDEQMETSSSEKINISSSEDTITSDDKNHDEMNISEEKKINSDEPYFDVEDDSEISKKSIRRATSPNTAITRFDEIAKSYEMKNWKGFIPDSENEITWFNNSKNPVNLPHDKKIQDYIERNTRGFLNVSLIATRNLLDQQSRNDLTVEKIRNDIVENYDNNEFGIYERLLIKKDNKNIAVIETVSKISQNMETEELQHGFFSEKIFLLDQFEDNFFTKVIQKNEGTTIYQQYDKTVGEINTFLNDDIAHIVRGTATNQRIEYNNKNNLTQLENLNVHLFQHFDNPSAKVAIWYANRLKKFDNHPDALKVDNAIRDLIAIINASTQEKNKYPQKIDRYPANSPTYKKYSTLPDNDNYIKNADDNDAYKLLAQEKFAKNEDAEQIIADRKKEQTKNDIQFSDEIIASPLYAQLRQPNNYIFSEAEQLRDEFHNAANTLKLIIKTLKNSERKHDLRIHVISALNLAINVVNHEVEIDVTKARISILTKLIQAISKILATTQPDQIDILEINGIRKVFADESEWRTNVFEAMNNINDAAKTYKSTHSLLNRFLATAKRHPIIVGALVGLGVVLVAAIITGIAITIITLTGGSAAIPLAGTATFLGGAVAGSAAATAITSFVGALLMALGAGLTGMFAGGIVGTVYATYQKIKQKFFGNPAEQPLRSAKILTIDKPDDVYQTDNTKPKPTRQINSNAWKRLSNASVSNQHILVTNKPFLEKYMHDNLAMLTANISDTDIFMTWLDSYPMRSGLLDAIGKLNKAVELALPIKAEFERFTDALQNNNQVTLNEMIMENAELKTALQMKNQCAEKWKDDNTHGVVDTIRETMPEKKNNEI